VLRSLRSAGPTHGRQECRRCGQHDAWAKIPPRRNRKDTLCFSPYLYRARGLFAVANPAVSPAIDALAAVAKAAKGAPRHHRRRSAGAISKRFGDVESGEIAQSAFGGASPRPEESLARSSSRIA
jgi:hypothetical protein